MRGQEKGFSRRQILEMTMGMSGLALTGAGSTFAQGAKRMLTPEESMSPASDLSHTTTTGRVVTIDAKFSPIAINTAKTAVIVVDMQNDFGAEGGMFQRAGIDISMIRAAVAPTAKTLAAARQEGIKVIYLKMAFKPDLSDAGAADSVNRVRHLQIMHVGKAVRAPNGAESRILIRDTWNTDILPELTPKTEDTVLYKTRFSGFYQTELDAILKRLGINYLIFTGCTTSICVESTIRDAMYRDFLPVLLADCTGEPIGHDLPRSNHEASLLTIQTLFGWVSSSNDFIKGLEARPATSNL
ncbi:MAG: cysteine hydrolase [Acidobacteria bacterium]|nr:cysteine hydrolase [Acidobacteriota bacterium]